jgi:histone deacetylase 11
MSFYQNGKAPLIFSPEYDFSLSLGARPKAYPFDFGKRGKAFHITCKALKTSLDEIHEPRPATLSDLTLVHSSEYLRSLSCPTLVARVMGIPELANFTSQQVDDQLLAPLRVATGGTILGAKLALEHGWAFNFSGGFHHAHADRAEGFCFYADTAVAIRALWRQQPDLNVIVVDVDAHGMNGLWELLGHDPRVTLFDIYNQDIYPASRISGRPYPPPPAGMSPKNREEYQRYLFPVESGISDRDYLGLLWHELPRALAEIPSPRLLIAHLGQDPFVGDSLGRMALSEGAILRRDAFIFEQASRNHIPILSLLAGGYSAHASTLIAKSLLNIIHRSMRSPLSEQPLCEKAPF